MWNRLLSTPRKSLSHVRLNLFKLRVLREWVNKTSALVLKSMLLEPIPALGFLLGPCDYIATVRLCLCACLSPSVCVGVCTPPSLLCVCCYFCDSLWAESRTEGIRIPTRSLGTSGCDWQEKKGSLCSGNWQQTPDPTQCNPAQYSTEPANMGKKYQRHCSPFMNPPYLSWLSANSHNPTAKPLAAFFS